MTDSEFEPILALHRLLDRHETLDDDLARIARLACDVVKRVTHVGVTILVGDKPSTAAATDRETLSLDEAQYRSGDGPCLTAHRLSAPVEITSVADDDRWPEFNREALAHGVHGSLSMPLSVEGEALGALNLYSDMIGPFDETDRQRAASFAEQASIALANALSFTRVAEMTEQLREALATRDMIGQAKGILMARHTITADEAFDRLRTTSQLQNRKLRSIAEDVARTGELPEA